MLDISLDLMFDMIFGLNNVDLSTVDKDCGVLKAMCTRCRDYMHTTQKRDEVQCNSCNKKEKRKVSINYVNE